MQYIYEAGLHCASSGRQLVIGVTQPRRVAAITVSRRVSEEMGGQSNFQTTSSKVSLTQFNEIINGGI